MKAAVQAALLRLLAWLGVALLITAPGSFSPAAELLGDPRIDVWNHAWGFSWVAESLAAGRLPWWTDRIGAPAGGVLYFIDLWGALWASPLSLLFGPAVGYNAVLVGRVALAGLGGQLLSEELGARGWAAALGGLACASSPFLLAELRNGISEVTAVGAVALALWATARAIRKNGFWDFIFAGVIWGAAAATSFYYGLVVADLGGLWLLVGLGARWRAEGVGIGPVSIRLVAVALASAPLALPPWLLFRASLAHEQALVRRPAGLDLALLEHNAVDPQIYFRPGAFQSVDLAVRYGEPFIHTGYLRWSVLGLAVLALVAAAPALRGRLRTAAALSALSLLMGLGSYLWFDGAWVAPGGWRLSLPFGWLRLALPQVAITHPLRLSVGAQVLLPALAAVGVAPLAARLGRPVGAVAVVASLLLLAEGLVGSAAHWPIPTSPAAIPAAYASLPPGMVLDLPVEAGTGMQTSAYFWYQTGHGRPLPWTPDVRLGSARDEALLRILGPERPAAGPVVEAPHPLDGAAIAHLRRHYGAVVLHGALARSAGHWESYLSAFTRAFGPPEVQGEDRIWRLSPGP